MLKPMSNLIIIETLYKNLEQESPIEKYSEELVVSVKRK